MMKNTIAQFGTGLAISIAVISILAGCGGGGTTSNDSGGSNGDTGGGSGGSTSISFIEWRDNANGAYVVDASNDLFRFRADSRYLYYNNTTYTNTWVDGDANLIWEGQDIGAVAKIQSDQGNAIAGLVSNNGYMIDIYGTESNPSWRETSGRPIFLTVTSAEESFADRALGRPIMDMNGQMAPRNRGDEIPHDMDAEGNLLPTGKEGAIETLRHD